MLRSPIDVLFSGYRRRVPRLLLLRPGESFHVREIACLTGTAPGTLHKELSKLADAGILVAERRANQLAYTANRPSPIYDELASIMHKASGLADILADILANALVPLADQIRIAFVFGSVARAQETADSDIDIMILNAATFGDIVKLLYPAQATLGREIDPKVMSLEEWQASVDRNDGFAQELINKPKVFVVGNDHDFAELNRNKP